MDKLIELFLGEAIKAGLHKLFGHKPERLKDTAGSIGCLIIMVMIILYPIGIYWLKPRLEVRSFWYEHIYTWPLYVVGLWIGYYVLKFFLHCLVTMPGITLFMVGFIWFCWYAFKQRWF